jgi:hypothetical protein
MSDPINQALALFTGYGKSRFPRARTADIAAVLGEETAGDLRDRILALYDELKQPLPEPAGKAGRKSVTERAVDALRLRHPELDEEGLAVLSWAYSFGLR